MGHLSEQIATDGSPGEVKKLKTVASDREGKKRGEGMSLGEGQT